MNFDHLRVGNVLCFRSPQSNPTNIASPQQDDNLYQTSQPWPTTRVLGAVNAISHPDVARPMGEGPSLKQMSNHVGRNFSKFKLNYILPDFLAPPKNQHVGTFRPDFVGYTDGTTRYIQSDSVVISKDFSGCLMVVYTHNGRRHVAHAPASQLQNMDCKQAFLTEIANSPTHNLIGWFRPFDLDLSDKQAELKAVYFNRQERYRFRRPDGTRTYGYRSVGLNYINSQREYTVMGLVDTNNRCYSIQGFQPDGYRNYFLITGMEKHRLNQNLVYPPGTSTVA